MIVVGADGSHGALEAVSWAIREADMRGTGVRIVHVVPAWADEIPVDAPHAYLGRRICESATSVLTEAVRWAGRETPEPRWSRSCCEGTTRLL